ncbi:MAG: hypothetical protein LBJ01_02260 [Tannerella sp.]|jgi:uncharacterized protein YoxC|nr:hypothetical protein [Tannerella sp.]
MDMLGSSGVAKQITGTCFPVSRAPFYPGGSILLFLNRSSVSLKVRSVGRCVRDGSGQIRELSENLRELSENLRELSENFRELSENLRELSENLRELSEDLRELSENFRELSEDLRELSEKIRELSDFFREPVPVCAAGFLRYISSGQRILLEPHFQLIPITKQPQPQTAGINPPAKPPSLILCNRRG